MLTNIQQSICISSCWSGMANQEGGWIGFSNFKNDLNNFSNDKILCKNICLICKNQTTISLQINVEMRKLKEYDKFARDKLLKNVNK